MTSTDNIFDACGLGSEGGESLNCVAGRMDTELADIRTQVESVAEGTNLIFLLFASIIMFLMQAGFAMVVAGSVRRKNVQFTLLKTILDISGSGIAYFICGYALAFGGSRDGMVRPEDFVQRRASTFVGSENFLLIGFDDYAYWLFQFALAATTTTIVGGALAERCQLLSYVLYSFVLAGFVFPVVSHAVWSLDGFLNAFKGNAFLGIGVIDVAGSGVVHVTGGTAALIATLILGSRNGRFYDDVGNPLVPPAPIQGHSVGMHALGTFLLWVGWYGLNTGSVHVISSTAQGDGAPLAALSAVNTTLATCCATLVATCMSAFCSLKRTGEIRYDITYTLNGCLAGLVAISGGCAVIEPWAACIVGIIAGLVYFFGIKVLVARKIDDAVDAICVHLFNGIWGTIAVGLFASPARLSGILQRYADHVGVFYSISRGSSDMSLLGANVVGLIFIIAFVTFTVSPFFFVLQYLGWFRADPLEEMIGLDLPYTCRGGGCSIPSDKNKVDHGKTSGQHLRLAKQKEKRRQERARRRKQRREQVENKNGSEDLEMSVDGHNMALDGSGRYSISSGELDGSHRHSVEDTNRHSVDGSHRYTIGETVSTEGI